MFSNCYSLTYLNLSSFEPSLSPLNAIFCYYMFYNCYSLISVLMPNFGNSYIQKVFYHMFEGCENLKYVNFKNYRDDRINNYYFYMFEDTPENMVICLPNYGASYLKANFTNNVHCGVINCDENWELSQKKINSETGECLNSCQDEFIYEYNTKCYKKCPKGTKVKEIQYLCEDILAESEINLTNEIYETTEISFENEIIIEEENE